MSVYSMTGYASVLHNGEDPPSAEGPSVSVRPRLSLEIRSVNSRFLDLSFRLSDELRAFEPALRELLTRSIRRGKVELRAGLDRSAEEALFDPAPRLLQRLGAAQDKVLSWLPKAKPLSVADVLRLAANTPAGSDEWQADVLPLAERALAAFLEARSREGERLASLMRERCAAIRALAQQAQPLIPKLVEQQRQRFIDRWNEACGLSGGDPSSAAVQERALSEATAFALRIDVAEELGRLLSHIEEIERLLDQGGEVGKRLEFLILELHREANTLGSKASTLELTRIAVDMKVLIEQMREQVQNIE